MAKRKKPKSEADLNVENQVTKQQVLKNAVASASIYVTTDQKGMNHITCFDGQVRQQGAGKLRSFDALYILLQTSAYHNFEEFFQRFHVDGNVTDALIHMQGKMDNASSATKEQLRKARDRNIELDKELKQLKETVRKVALKLDPRVDDPQAEIKTAKRVLSKLVAVK